MTSRTYSSPTAFKQALEQRHRSSTKTDDHPFGVDVAFGDPISGDTEGVVAEDVLAFAGVAPPTLPLYPLESHIAEKLHAYTMPRNRPNSRIKDLPDLALLATVRDLEGAALRAAINQTFDYRATHPVPESFPEPPSSWAAVYEKMASHDGLQWPTIVEVTEAVRTFLNPVLAGTTAHWETITWTWCESI